MLERPYRLLALVPAVAIIGAPLFANRIDPRVAGMPFLLAWIVGWIIMTSIIMTVIRVLDERHEKQRG